MQPPPEPIGAHQHERADPFGHRERRAERDRPAHREAQEVELAEPQRLDETQQQLEILLHAEVLGGILGAAIAGPVEREHPVALGERRQARPEAEVRRVYGGAVQQHERRAPPRFEVVQPQRADHEVFALRLVGRGFTRGFSAHGSVSR